MCSQIVFRAYEFQHLYYFYFIFFSLFYKTSEAFSIIVTVLMTCMTILLAVLVFQATQVVVSTNSNAFPWMNFNMIYLFCRNCNNHTLKPYIVLHLLLAILRCHLFTVCVASWQWIVLVELQIPCMVPIGMHFPLKIKCQFLWWWEMLKYHFGTKDWV